MCGLGEGQRERRRAAWCEETQFPNCLRSRRDTTSWKEEGDWVFASPYFDGEMPYSPRHVAEDHLWPSYQAAGLGEKLGWKAFRRTYSSLLRALGVDIKVQQELTRHSDIRTTSDGTRTAIRTTCETLTRRS